jgi:hypothetical protein
MRQSLPLVFALSVLTSTASAAPVYRVQAIPPMTDARAVNATGTVAGLGMLNGAPAAFVLVPFNAATLANPQTVTAPKPLLR